MIELSLIPTIYDNLDNIEKIKGQLIYCTDTGNVAYDIDDLLRIDIGCARLLDSEDEREKLTDPKINTLYIVKLSNTCWRYDSTIGWAEITYYEAIQDILIAAGVFTPMTICINGVYYAPKTLAEYVFLRDGSNLQDYIDEFMEKGAKITLDSRTVPVEIMVSGTKYITIPFPVSTYDVRRFPILILYNNVKLNEDSYAISKDELVLCDSLAKNTKKHDIVTFVFAWANALVNDGIDATMINHVRYLTGPSPLDPQKCIDGDMWMNTDKKELCRWNVDKKTWEVILSDRKRLVKHIENVVEFDKPTNFVYIGIDGYDPKKDMLIVFKNGTKMIKDKQYRLSSNGLYIIPPLDSYWDTTSKNVFEFVVLKNVPDKDYEDFDDDNYSYQQEYLEMKETMNSLVAKISELETKINNQKS